MFFKKRFYLCFIILFFILNFKTVLAVEIIDEYSQLTNAVASSDGDCDLDIIEDLNADCSMGVLNKDLNINGNNHEIFGNSHCSGLEVLKDKYLNLKDLNITNFSGERGGVVYNNSNLGIDLENCSFLNNSASDSGGAIYNEGKAGNLSIDFINNYATNNGGAIYNHMDSEISNIEGLFSNNSADGFGGAIYNYGKIDNIKGDFNSNKSSMYFGGAIANQMDIGSIEANFSNNEAGFAGGAIYNNWGNIGEIKGNFSSNKTEFDMMGGGAIANLSGTIGKLSGEFIENSTNGLGGAIYNSMGTINIVSDENDTIFSNNHDSTGQNAIYNDGGNINLNAGDYDITINDSITGSNAQNSIIEINQNNGLSNWGKVSINNNVSSNTVNMRNGLLEFGYCDSYQGNFDNTVNFNYFAGQVSLENNNIQNTNLGNLELHSDMDLKIDGDFSKFQLDTISADSFKSNNYKINISNINLINPTNAKNFSISPLSSSMDENVWRQLADSIDYTGGDIVYSPIYKYFAQYDRQNGLINFSLPQKDIFNPAVLTAPVAAQIGGYLNLLNIYEKSFANMDMYMMSSKNERTYSSTFNKYVSNKPLYAHIKTNYDKRYGWVRPYSMFEKVNLKNLPDVKNIGYGSFLGIDMVPFKLKNNMNLDWGYFVGYDGSNQKYQGVDIYQNGGVLGLNSMVYKNDFFGGLTAAVGANGCKAYNNFGSEDFGAILAGIALKTGYNFEFKKGKYIIQPDFLISYSYIYTFGYKNSADVTIDTKSLHAIQIEPCLKFFANLENGIQPYASVSVTWNLLDKTRFRANDVVLPELSVKPFVRYGLGVRKIWNDKYDAFFKLMLQTEAGTESDYCLVSDGNSGIYKILDLELKPWVIIIINIFFKGRKF